MRVLSTTLAASIFALLSHSTVLAADEAGKVTLLTGRGTATDQAGSVRILQRKADVFAQDTLSTGPNSYLNVRFTDGGKTLLRPNSRYLIADYAHAQAAASAAPTPTTSGRDRALLQILKGGLRTVTGNIGKRNRANYSVRTPVATVGIRGTDFTIRYCANDCQDIYPQPPNGLYTTVHSGSVTLQNGVGEVVLETGQNAYTSSFDNATEILPEPPEVLLQDPLPDPKNCDVGG